MPHLVLQKLGVDRMWMIENLMWQDMKTKSKSYPKEIHSPPLGDERSCTALLTTKTFLGTGKVNRILWF